MKFFSMVLYIDSFEKTALVALDICPTIELSIICYRNHERRCDLLNHFSHAQSSIFAKTQQRRRSMYNAVVRFENYVKKYKGAFIVPHARCLFSELRTETGKSGIIESNLILSKCQLIIKS